MEITITNPWAKVGLALPFLGTAGAYFLAPSELPVVYLLLLLIATFGVISFSLFFSVTWFNSLSPKNQLVFGPFQYVTTPKKKGSIFIVKYVQPALLIANNADFSISYIVESFEVTLEGGSVDNNPRQQVNMGSVIPPRTSVRFQLPFIDVEALSLPKKAG